MAVSVIVPLAIILSVSGVYCPPTEEFPSRYPLQSCKSNSEHLQLDSPGSVFEIVRSERNPRKYCLIQKLPDNTRKRRCCFRKKEVEFVSLKDAELTMMIYLTNDPDNPFDITCVFQCTSLARKFHKHMTHELSYGKVLLLGADYLKKPDDTELATDLYLYADCFDNYVTIVMKDFYDNPFLIFPTGAVSQIMRSDATEISFYISTNPDEEEFYKLGFSSVSRTSACEELLYRLCPHIIATTLRTNRQLDNDPIYERLFNRIDRAIRRQIENINNQS